MNDKSIAIVCSSPGFGGLEMNTLKVAKWLEQQGWKIRLLANELSSFYKEAAMIFNDVTSLQQIKKGTSTANIFIVRKWLLQESTSILFTPYNKDLKAIAGYKRFFNRKIKLVYQQHMQVGINKRDIIHRLRYDMLDLWISPLPYLKKETMQKTHVPNEKIKIIHLGLETEKFINTTRTPKEARNHLNIPSDACLLGVLGRIDPKKGQDFPIKAIAYLRDHYSKDYHLLIMGGVTPHEGEDFLNHLHELVKEYRLEDRVHFRPYEADVNLFYKAIDVFVMPSHGETYGMVTLEAMLSEKPVIGVNQDGTKELLQHGKLGWLHELEDINDFCRQLFSLETDPSSPEIIKLAKAEVLKNFSMEQMMRETDKALLQLLNH